ncbi:MAG: hypothetical protein K2J32_05245, partial [Ruminococcus sp.]|nr:hypothetical protein [Ruminococcus sp.]
LRYIAVLSVFLLSGCGQMGEITEVKKPEQELMFLIKYDNWSEEEIHSASLITTDGKHIEVPDNLLGENGEMGDDWAEQLIQLSENTLVECTLPENDLAVMYDFVNSAEIENVPVFMEYADTIYDVGFDTLYLLKKTDGIYTKHKLCVSGQTNECIKSDKIIDFCNFMRDKKYYRMYYPI